MKRVTSALLTVASFASFYLFLFICVTSVATATPSGNTSSYNTQANGDAEVDSILEPTAIIPISGDISSDTTWTGGNVYYVTGDVTVLTGVTLTIQPGTIVKFQSSRRLLVAGKLTAAGTSGEPMYFTSYRDDSIGGDTDGGGVSSGAPGDWGWIQFVQTSDDTSVIDHAVIRYGGYVSSGIYRGNIHIRDSSPTISNSTIAYSTEDGIFLESTLGLGSSWPTITNNTFDNNDNGSISMDAASLLTLTGNTSVGNAPDGVRVRGGTVDGNATWDQSNMIYHLYGNVTVANGSTLTIGPGMIFKSNDDRRLVVAGKLTVAGSSDQPVYFTSYRDDSIGGDTDGGGVSTGTPGDWGWIEFAQTSDDNSLIDHAIIRYGGYVSYNINRGNIYLKDASPTISNSTVAYSTQDGIYLESTLELGGSWPTITGTTFDNNDNGSISMDAASLLTLTGNTSLDNAPDGVRVRGGTVDGNATWDQSNMIYHLYGDVTVANGSTLTVGPGMIFKSNDSRRLVVAGKLTVAGSSDQPVYFTSFRDDSIGGDTDGGGVSTGAPGDWGWIEFAETSDDNSLIDHAIIRYGGYVSYNINRGNIYLKDASPTISNSTVAYSSRDGLYTETSSPTLVCNDIRNNTALGIRNSTPSTIITALNQYWGSPSGPYHVTLNPSGQDNGVSDGVNFIPWRTSPCDPFGTPTSLTAAGISQTQIDLGWQDNATVESDFRIERSPNGTSGWAEIATIGANVTNFSDTGLTCGTVYYYRVRAHRDSDNGYTLYSNVASASTQPCPPPSAPTNVSATAVSRTRIDLSWQDTSNESHFYIERSPNGNTGWSLIATMGADITAYSNTGLWCGTVYYYRIRAYRQSDGQYSAYSNIASGTTMTCLKVYLPAVIKNYP